MQKYRIKRYMLLSVAYAYGTVSTVELSVVTTAVPMDLIVKERMRIHGESNLDGSRKKNERERKNDEGVAMVEMTIGCWTRRLIPQIVDEI